MIRNTLILCSVLISQCILSQDEIIFADGKIREVKIVKVSEARNEISYVTRKKTFTVHIDEVIQYKWNDTWYSYDKKNNELIASDNSMYNAKRHALMQPSNFTYGLYSIAATFSPALNSNKRWMHGVPVANNPRIRVEPEIFIFNWLSIKFPMVVGLSLEQDYPIVNSYPVEFPDYYQYGGPGALNSQRGINFTYTTYNDLSIKPTYGSENRYYSYYYYSSSDPDYGKNHTNEILYQFGITPKIFPFGQTKNALYISQSFNIGYGNKNRVDYYATFEDTLIYDSYTNSMVDHWALVNENTIAYKEGYVYFRYEGMLGFNFNWTKSINFCIESGISTILKNNTVEDQIYINTPGTGYELSSSRVFESERGIGSLLKGHFINRFHLIYRFGGERKSNPKLRE